MNIVELPVLNARGIVPPKQVNYPQQFTPSKPKTEGKPPGTRFGGLLTHEVPLRQFSGDIVIPAGAQVSIDVRRIFQEQCTDLSFVNITSPFQASINASPFFTVYTDRDLTNAEIMSLVIIAGLSAVTVQLAGV